MGCYMTTSDTFQREGTETHLCIRITVLLLQSPNLSWMLGLKYNGRSKAQCFHHRHLSPIFSVKSSDKPNMDWVAPFKTTQVWRQLRQQISLSDWYTYFSLFHRRSWCPKSCLSRSTEGKPIHTGHTSIRLQLILLPYVPLPHIWRGAVLKPTEVTMWAKYPSSISKELKACCSGFCSPAQNNWEKQPTIWRCFERVLASPTWI